METICETKDMRVVVRDDAIAEVVFGPAGGMPVCGRDTHRELSRFWRTLDERPDVRAILVRSEGKGFCAGGEHAMIEQMISTESVRLTVMREAREIVQAMLDCDKPIVSAINGAAVGAGLATALMADITVAARGAKLIDGHTRIGVAAGDHAALVWPLLCGMAKAKYYVMLCEPIVAEEAERIGLVSLCVEPAEVQARAAAIAERLAKGSPTAIQWTKRSLNHWFRLGWPAFEHSVAAELNGFANADAREGLAAITAKREPRFGSAG
jgi:enoyl-CoA hydratase